jgi:NADH:ubiquinone oxidoreductase subunit 5 (subunit L)/multisubunit Na+/H+ antiporter MnhA subunit
VPGFLVRNAWLVPFFPLAGAAVTALFGYDLKRHAGLPVVVGIALAFLVSLGLLGAAGP